MSFRATVSFPVISRLHSVTLEMMGLSKKRMNNINVIHSSINNMKHKKLHFVISLAPPSGLEPETP